MQGELRVAFRLIAGLEIEPGAEWNAFCRNCLKLEKPIPVEGISGAVGELQARLKEKAIDCILERLK